MLQDEIGVGPVEISAVTISGNLLELMHFSAGRTVETNQFIPSSYTARLHINIEVDASHVYIRQTRNESCRG